MIAFKSAEKIGGTAIRAAIRAILAAAFSAAAFLIQAAATILIDAVVAVVVIVASARSFAAGKTILGDAAAILSITGCSAAISFVGATYGISISAANAIKGVDPDRTSFPATGCEDYPRCKMRSVLFKATALFGKFHISIH